MKRCQKRIPFHHVCSICLENHPIEQCQLLTEVKHVADNNPPTLARLSIPRTLNIRDTLDGVTVIAKVPLCRGTQFGPFKAELTDSPPSSGFILQMFHDNGKPGAFLDSGNENKCNWMCLVAAAENSTEQNLVAYQVDQKIYFSVMKNIEAGDELKVWYAPFYAVKMNKNLLSPEPGVAILEPPVEDFSVDNGESLKKKKEKRKIPNFSLPIPGPHVEKLTPEQLGAKVIKDQWPCRRCSVVEKTVPNYAKHLMAHLQEEIKLALRLEKVNSQENHPDKGVYLLKLNADKSNKAHNRIPEGKILQIEANNQFELKDTLLKEGTVKESGLLNSLKHQNEGENILLKQLNPLDSSSMKNSSLERKLTSDVSNKIPSEKSSIENTNSLDSVNILDFDDLNISNLEKTMSLNNLLSLDDIFLNQNSEDGKNKISNKETYASMKTYQGDTANKIDRVDFDFSNKCTSNSVDISCSNLDYLTSDYQQSKIEPKEIICDKLNTNDNLSRNLNFSNILDAKKQLTSDINKNLNSVKQNLNDPSLSGTNGTAGCKNRHFSLSKLLSESASFKNAMNPVLLASNNHSQSAENSLNASLLKNVKFAIALPAELKDSKLVVSSKTGVQDYTCDICMHEYTNARYLLRHLRLHLGAFTCSRCSRAFSRKQTLEDHTCKVFACEKCDRRFYYLSHFQKHKHWHKTKEKRNKAKQQDEFRKCKLCDIKFSSRFRLQLHNQKVHSIGVEPKQLSNKNCLCSICGAVYLDKRSLSTHLQKHGEPKFECYLCDKKYHRKDVLKKHISTIHGQVRFQCPHCPSSFATEYSYQCHVSIHSNYSPFKCKFCGKILNRKLNLERHEQRHLQETLPCQQCNQTFISEKAFEKHSRAHLKRKSYPCSQCSQVFPGPKKLKIHYQEVHMDRPFTCSFCYMSIRKLANLKRHLQSQHKNRQNEWKVPGFFDSLKYLTDKHENMNELNKAQESVSIPLPTIVNCQNVFETLGFSKTIPSSTIKLDEFPGAKINCSNNLNNDLEQLNIEAFNNDIPDPVTINFDIDSNLKLGIFNPEATNIGLSDATNKTDTVYEDTCLLTTTSNFNAVKKNVLVPSLTSDKLNLPTFNILKENMSLDLNKPDIVNIMIDRNQLYSSSILDSNTLNLNTSGREILWTVTDVPSTNCIQETILPSSLAGTAPLSEIASTNENLLFYVLEPTTTEVSNNSSELALF